MRLGDIMSEAVETIDVEANAEAAREKMRLQEVGHLVVLEKGAVAGIVAEADVRRVAATKPVRELMSAPVVTATPQTTVREAANLLRGRHVGCLPIVDRKRQLVGMVTVSDLLDLIGKGVTREPKGDDERQFVPGR